jgi:threonine dehydrogenase-like Zn-dependent dehydrogenase
VPTAAAIVAAAGARYVATQETEMRDVAEEMPPLDIIMEATGKAEPGFEAMEILGNNGVLMLLSVTGGTTVAPVPIDAITKGLILGNKIVAGSVNSAREDFEFGVKDLARWESLWPGLASRLITRRLSGLNDYARILEEPPGDIKTVIEVNHTGSAIAAGPANARQPSRKSLDEMSTSKQENANG